MITMRDHLISLYNSEVDLRDQIAEVVRKAEVQIREHAIWITVLSISLGTSIAIATIAIQHMTSIGTVSLLAILVMGTVPQGFQIRHLLGERRSLSITVYNGKMRLTIINSELGWLINAVEEYTNTP